MARFGGKGLHESVGHAVVSTMEICLLVDRWLALEIGIKLGTRTVTGLSAHVTKLQRVNVMRRNGKSLIYGRKFA